MKAVVTDINSIPEPVRGEYEEKDGAFYLRLEGTPGFVPAVELATTNEKLAEFRNNNVSLLKEKQQLELRLKSLEGIDPIEYSKTKKEIEELRAEWPSGLVEDFPPPRLEGAGAVQKVTLTEGQGKRPAPAPPRGP